MEHRLPLRSASMPDGWAYILRDCARSIEPKGFASLPGQYRPLEKIKLP
nr:MAG TPA: hypothetical protein [Caudoviricetes sp.]